MITANELRGIAQARLTDAEILYKNRRYDGAIYLCGYVIELFLKARICQTLNWDEFPSESNEFKNLNNFKTHNLDILLHLSGIEQIIIEKHFYEWSIIAIWDPIIRYNPVGTANKTETLDMLTSVKTLKSIL